MSTHNLDGLNDTENSIIYSNFSIKKIISHILFSPSCIGQKDSNSQTYRRSKELVNFKTNKQTNKYSTNFKHCVYTNF